VASACETPANVACAERELRVKRIREERGGATACARKRGRTSPVVYVRGSGRTSVARIIGKPGTAAVELRDLAHESEAESGAALAGRRARQREEFLEHACTCVVGQARTVVTHRDFDVRFHRPRLDVDL